MRIRAAAHVLALSTCASPCAAAAADVPVAGSTLRLDAGGPETRRARLLLADPAIAPPFPDLAAAGARLRLHGGVAPGQCHAVIDLDRAGWRPIDGDGARRGFRWRDPSGSRAGVRRVVVRPGQPCGNACPPECVAAGAVTVRDCQAVQVAEFVAARHDVPTPALVTGDFNEPPGSFVWHELVDRGWSDAYLAAGLPECDPATGVGCTSGRFDAGLADLESPASGELERIDYVFLVPPAAGACTFDAAYTRLFADDPNPFAPACGPAPDPPCWPSDHEGVQVGLDCR